MVGTKSRGYLNSGRLSEGEYSMPFFCTRHSPNSNMVMLLVLKVVLVSNMIYLHGKQLNCVYLVVCSDIDIVPYVIDISIFSMDR